MEHLRRIVNSPSNMPTKIKLPAEAPIPERETQVNQSPATEDKPRQVSPRTNGAKKPSRTAVTIVYQHERNRAHVSVNGKELSCPINEVDIELEADGSGFVALGIRADKITVKQANFSKPRRRR